MSGTHARFAPSGLARLMVCPGSHGLEQGFPEDEEGEAAKEGTAAHEVMAALVQLDYLPQKRWHQPPDKYLGWSVLRLYDAKLAF